MTCICTDHPKGWSSECDDHGTDTAYFAAVRERQNRRRQKAQEASKNGRSSR